MVKNELTYDAGTRDGARMRTTGSYAQVVAMQQALKDEDFDPGATDGVMGPRTAAALKRYRRRSHRRIPGRVALYRVSGRCRRRCLYIDELEDRPAGRAAQITP